jgi:hypothetical protein
LTIAYNANDQTVQCSAATKAQPEKYNICKPASTAGSASSNNTTTATAGLLYHAVLATWLHSTTAHNSADTF